MNETHLILSFAHFKRTAKLRNRRLRETGKSGRRQIVMEELKPVSHLIQVYLQKVNKIFDGIKFTGSLLSSYTGIEFELTGEKLPTGQYCYRAIVRYREQTIKQREALSDGPVELDKDPFSKLFTATYQQDKLQVQVIQNRAAADKWYPFRLTAATKSSGPA